MQLDQETLRPVIIAMALYIITSIIVPRVIKKPTGFGPLDELIMTITAQQGSITSGAILVGLIVLGTNYIQEELL